MCWKKKIIQAIFGNLNFNDLPNRRLDKFFNSQYLLHLRTNPDDRMGFTTAFEILRKNGYIRILAISDTHISNHYFDAYDLLCDYAVKQYKQCFITLTEKGQDAWYNFRKTGEWEKNDFKEDNTDGKNSNSQAA